MPLLYHAGCVEEVMRDTQERLLRIYDSGPLFLPRALRQARGLQAQYYRIHNLDTLRLPVSRKYSEILVAEKSLAPMAETVQQLQSSVVNYVVIALAIAALLLTLTLGVPQLVSLFDGSQNEGATAGTSPTGQAAPSAPTSPAP